MAVLASIPIERDAPIPTWFGVGGRADRLARPRTTDDLRACLALDPALRVLGDGANLLVDDDGVAELVVVLDAPAFRAVERIGDRSGEAVIVRAGAGSNLPKLINETVRLGLAGLEGLDGSPATVGGALVMNAGGAFGQIADAVVRVHAIDREGRDVTLERSDIGFGYRRSGLDGLLLTACDFALHPAETKALRARHLEVMEYKKRTQPLAAQSAGCCFKNPTLDRALEGIGSPGERVSAGLLIERTGCKGEAVGSARVSDLHANFLVPERDGRARDVIALMDVVARRVFETFGVRLEREVVVWRRGEA
ncbi:MAG TPA: FAD-binding protein [Phycisphaerales bacterium]|nr:FAD-binding protein [Phycisphaerales bacterium]